MVAVKFQMGSGHPSSLGDFVKTTPNAREEYSNFPSQYFSQQEAFTDGHFVDVEVSVPRELLRIKEHRNNYRPLTTVS